MGTENEYGGDQIQILEGLEAVRKRHLNILCRIFLGYFCINVSFFKFNLVFFAHIELNLLLYLTW